MHIQENRLRQQLTGKNRSICNQKVLDAMLSVPRHLFVPLESRQKAYDDCALPIGHDQTISQPYMVALMSEALSPEPHQRILEIGTGSGYQTAILSNLVGEVFSIECVTPLLSRAEETLNRLGCLNVHLRDGNGHLGWRDEAPFDGILISCAPEEIPWKLTEQLKPDGQMIVPAGVKKSQKLIRIYSRKGEGIKEDLLDVSFVPMVEEQTSA